jgi:hypothetical protein
MQIAVVGPTRAGKTVYLACLLRAAFARQATRPIKVRADPASPATVALDRMAAAVIRGESVPATSDVTQLELLADLPGSVVFGIGRETLRLQMTDVPGGGCFPPLGVAVAPEVAQSVAEADALLVILPADAAVRPDDMADRLKHLVRSALRARSSPRAGRPFLRIAVVVSMAELLVDGRGRNALAELEERDAQREVSRLCGESFLAVVRALVPPGADWYSLVSAFGFDPESGESVAEPTADGWRVKTDGQKFRDSWWPYRAFEPLEFLGRGVCWREAI